ncbi:hypothetical protein OL229_14250 [Neisseriaceae bacterium JH1-16]|nr:hypothetical protein [Neisseriaceae bacterium JH1-16]
MTPAPAVPATSSLEQVTIVPRHFQVQGMNAVPLSLVAPRLAATAGKPLTLQQLGGLAASITNEYKQRGYVLSYCYVPQQDFADGNVRLVVVEGYVNELKPDGQAGNAEAMVRKVAGALLNERPLTQATFERVAGLLSTLPGAPSTVTINPPTTTDGATAAQIVSDRKMFSSSVSLDSNHPGIRGTLIATLNGLTPLAEQTTVSVLIPSNKDSERYVGIRETVPMSANGLKVVADYSNYRNRYDALVSTAVGDFQREVLQEKGSLALSYPVVVSGKLLVNAALGVQAARDSDRYKLQGSDLQLASETHTRAATLSVDAVQAAWGGRNSANLAYAHGFDTAGASSQSSQVDLAYQKLLLGLGRFDDWGGGYSSQLSGVAQFSDDVLPSSEQLSFGGNRFGRAFDPGAIGGDKGWAASLELGKRFSWSNRWLNDIQVYLFGEHARTSWNTPGIASAGIGSAGMGTRLSDSRHYLLDLSLARPVSVPAGLAERYSVRYNVSYSYKFN